MSIIHFPIIYFIYFLVIFIMYLYDVGFNVYLMLTSHYLKSIGSKLSNKWFSTSFQCNYRIFVMVFSQFLYKCTSASANETCNEQNSFGKRIPQPEAIPQYTILFELYAINLYFDYIYMCVFIFETISDIDLMKKCCIYGLPPTDIIQWWTKLP